MLNQSFDEKTLLKLTTKKEIINFKLGRSESDYVSKLSQISKTINNESFNFHSISNFTYKNKVVYRTNSPEEFYALRKITDNIKRIYKVKFSNKDEIVSQVINILSDTSSYNIIRLDVKDFFESINFHSLLIKLETDNILSNASLNHLKKLKKLLPPDFDGLPRGLSISSVLSELFMEDIDEKIRSTPGIYFYARYVDDIIIISHNKNHNIDHFRKIFITKSLDLNKKSSHLEILSINTDSEASNFTFLGYTYHIHHSINECGDRKLSIDMSSKKIKKIKSRVISTILSFSKDSNYTLLTNRIKFLSGNYIVKIDTNYKQFFSNDDSGALKGGIYYNNKFITTNKSLSEINIFIKKLLFCKKNNAVGKAVRSIPINIRRSLLSHCFIVGHNRIVIHDFDASEIKKIKQCWY